MVKDIQKIFPKATFQKWKNRYQVGLKRQKCNRRKNTTRRDTPSVYN